MLPLMIKYLVKPLCDFIYPPLCLTCNQYFELNELFICTQCLSSIKRINRDNLILAKLKAKLEYESFVKDIFSSFLFEKEGKLQELIHLLKYQGMKFLGISFGIELGKKISSEAAPIKVDYLLPVPLHKIKQRERGYNQSEYIAKGITKVISIPVNTTFLFRKKYTQSQTNLTYEERIENVANAFEITKQNRNMIENKTFIVVDDVITTGATINACANTLISNGAASVYAASIAIAS